MFEIQLIDQLRQRITKDIIDHDILSHDIPIFSEYSASNIFLFRSTYGYEIVPTGPVLATGTLRDGRSFALPLPSAALALTELPSSIKEEVHYFYPVCEMAMDENSNQHNQLESPRDLADYVYDSSMLLELPGSKFSRERQGIRSLFRNHECEFRWTEPSDVSIVNEWLVEKSLPDGAADAHEFREAIAHLDALRLKGITAKVDGKVEAVVIYDESIPKNCFVLFLKSTHTHPYLFYAVYKELAARVPKNTKINLCQDLGIPGLRRKKMALYPEIIAQKYAADVTSISKQVPLERVDLSN